MTSPTSILTASGRYVDPTSLRVEDVDLADIAHALAHQCRFTGHTLAFYSVAEHSVRVARYVGDGGWGARAQLAALLHDASEAYLVDLPLPLKRHTELGAVYRVIEAEAQRTIDTAFGTVADGELERAIKRADLVLLATERRDLLPATSWKWPVLEGVEPLFDHIRPWTSAFARELFIAKARSLMAALVAPAALAPFVCRVDESGGVA